MKRRIIRAHSARAQRYSKYLKPGALARIRDSRIHSHFLTHRFTSLSTRSLPPQSPTTPHQDVTQIDFLPEFPVSGRGPHCFGRKKLVAAKSILNPLSEPSNLLVH